MKVAYYVASSLDGFIAGPHDDVEFLNRYMGTGDDYGYAEFYASIDVVLMGSKTYEFALAHGSWQSPDKPSIVFTRRDLPQAHPSVTLTSESARAVVEGLRKQGHQRAWLMGGGKLAADFLHHRLIDELLLALTPDILGDGVRLFAHTGETISDVQVERMSETAHENGIVQLHYQFK